MINVVHRAQLNVVKEECYEVVVDSPTGGGCSDKHGKGIAAPLLEAESLGARILVTNQIRQYKKSVPNIRRHLYIFMTSTHMEGLWT